MTDATSPEPPSPSAATVRLISGFWAARAVHAMAALALAEHLPAASQSYRCLRT